MRKEKSTLVGTWPEELFWMVAGQNWPQKGEINIIKGINKQMNNQMTLHIAPGCTLDTSVSATSQTAFSGKVLSTMCNALINSNSGCGVTDPFVPVGVSMWHGWGGASWWLWLQHGLRATR